MFFWTSCVLSIEIINVVSDDCLSRCSTIVRQNCWDDERKISFCVEDTQKEILDKFCLIWDWLCGHPVSLFIITMLTFDLTWNMSNVVNTENLVNTQRGHFGLNHNSAILFSCVTLANLPYLYEPVSSLLKWNRNSTSFKGFSEEEVT